MKTLVPVSSQRLLLSFCCMLLGIGDAAHAASAPSTQGVTATAAAPTTEYIYFDPNGPHPPEVPADMKGNTQPKWKYSNQFSWSHHDTPPTFKLHFVAAECTVALETKITLAKNASDHLKAHEEGHRHINERFYNTYAKQAIKEAAETVVGKDFTARAPTYEEAKKQILAKAVKQLASEYEKRTSVIAKQANVYYDTTTNHGRNDVDQLVAAEEAIKRFAPGGEAAAQSTSGSPQAALEASPATLAAPETPQVATPATLAPAETPQAAAPSDLAAPQIPQASAPASPSVTVPSGGVFSGGASQSSLDPVQPVTSPPTPTTALPVVQTPVPYTVPEPKKSLAPPLALPTPQTTPPPSAQSNTPTQDVSTDVVPGKKRKSLPPPSSIFSP